MENIRDVRRFSRVYGFTGSMIRNFTVACCITGMKDMH